jgi:hypothetical protein
MKIQIHILTQEDYYKFNFFLFIMQLLSQKLKLKSKRTLQ